MESLDNREQQLFKEQKLLTFDVNE